MISRGDEAERGVTDIAQVVKAGVSNREGVNHWRRQVVWGNIYLTA